MFLRRFTRTTDGKTQTLVEDSRPSMLPRRLSHYLRSKPDEAIVAACRNNWSPSTKRQLVRNSYKFATRAPARFARRRAR